MMNLTLYRREMKGSIRLLLIFGAVMTLYISIIISMYDPEMMKTLDNFAEVMPDLMASVGMKAHASNLLGFMVSYLYGFILLIFPMVFSILRGNALIARYVDKGSAVPGCGTGKAVHHCLYTNVRTHKRYCTSYFLQYHSGTDLCCKGLSGRTGHSQTPRAQWRAALSAFIYWQYLFSCLLPFFRHQIQPCFRGWCPRIDVCAANACQCRRDRRKSQIFHLLYFIQC